MLKRYPLVQAGNTKPAMTTFSDAIVLRDGDATRKEAISRFVGDIDNYAHASIWHHLNSCLHRTRTLSSTACTLLQSSVWLLLIQQS